jgi:trans-aconitate 2-methyltransferase
LFTYHAPEFYYDLLSEASIRVSIWQTTYFHVMANHQGLLDWYASTGMRPYLEKLADDGQRLSFREHVLEEIRGRFALRKDRKILFPFRRLFFIACKE